MRARYGGLKAHWRAGINHPSYMKPTTVNATNWAEQALPDAWPDQMDLRLPWNLARFLKAILWDRPRPVQLPPELVGADRIPRYILQEFHNLPNGNYSKKVARGYAKGFDRVMLGTLHEARREIARRIGAVPRTLDIGCGAGHTAGAMLEAGADQVWALDPSPYLLQYAAELYPEVHFTHGVAECMEFADASFDGASACFVFHEIPPRYADQALAELARILRTGARLVIVEPATLNRRGGVLELMRRYGWRGLYFKLLANRIFEPFLDAWHRRDIHSWLDQHGFDLEEDQEGCPLRLISARRR